MPNISHRSKELHELIRQGQEALLLTVAPRIFIFRIYDYRERRNLALAKP
jgi:hypothetical protein